MKQITCIIAAAALVGATAGCASPYYPRYGYSQSYYYPSGYTYYAPPRYSYTYYQPRYGYRSHWDYYRNYRGSHPPAEGRYP
jgi:hypothetical protein